MPRWVTLGLVGVLMLFVGVTWEARVRDAVAARSYLRSLR